MSRRKAPLQLNQFIGGLNTDASPLDFPLESSIDELNMTMERDGSRRKRFGFDLEDDYVEVDSTVAYDSSKTLARKVYLWENVGGDAEKSLLVVQVGSSIHIFDNEATVVSGDKIYSKTYSSDYYDVSFSFASVDGLLVVVTGDKDVYVYEYDSSGDSITESTQTLFIRDLFGVQATASSTDLTLPQNLSIRPASLPDEHLYNLRNQGFNRPWYNNNTETLTDPIAAFYSESGSTEYPSNADNINTSIYADPNDSDNRLIERFFSENLYNTKPDLAPAPQGSYIIDALERGPSREAAEALSRTNYSELSLSVTTLGADTTPGGPSTVGSYAGRVWFGGFSGIVEGGDSKSPRMSSYILFSLRVKDSSDIGRCYQLADPTSLEDADLVDTDGGFIRIDEAYNINNLTALDGNLYVFAENGVWRVSGVDGASFTATGYEVRKMSDRGCIASHSVVVADNQILYWAEDGINRISQNDLGIWLVSSISDGKVQNFYLETLTEVQRLSCTGSYDNFQRQVKWVYTNVEGGTDSEELIYDIRFNAFLKYKVSPNTQGGNLPKVISPGDSILFSATPTVLKETVYLVITDLTTNVLFSFGRFDDTMFYDWSSSSQTAYSNYLQSGFITLGEPRSRKQAATVQTFFKRTEDGFDDALEATNQSSCLISGRYKWSDASISKKWSTQRQAYRLPSVYIPADSSDTYETGFELVNTRNRIRGFGNSVSIRLDGEAGKNMHVYGWAFDMTASSEE